METMKTKSNKALTHMIVVLVVVIGFSGIISIWKADLVKSIYFIDEKTIILNGMIFLLFLMGIIHLIKAFHHYSFEEKQIVAFIREKETAAENFIENISLESIIVKRYFSIKDLYERQVPIHHGALSSIMAAEESLYQSFPKFVNNVLILTGVFGTIVSLIFALVGATSVLETTLPGEGMGVMLLGMNTALTTTATAIVCFFLFTYFYQRLTDIQTYVFGKIEEAVITYIVPEFSFDSEAINYRTQLLIKELSDLVSELKTGSGFIQDSLTGLNDHNQQYLEKMGALITKQDNQLGKTENVIGKLEKIKDVLVNGFRLKS